MTDRRTGTMAGLLLAGMALAAAAGAALPGVAEAAAPDAGGRYDMAVDAAIARYRPPGIAVGVIEDGEVAYVRTAGETVAGSGDPVTPDTLFKIASNSKAMTAAVLARLVQAGKLRWDDPVVEHLPWFAMHDPWVTRNMTVRDLLVHNSGLPEGGGDLMLWPEPNHFTREDIIRGLRHIPPAYGFRAGYAYDNLLYVVAGEVAAAVGGDSFESLVRAEIFEPLGLHNCRVGEFDRSGLSVAQPHYRDDGRNVAYRIDPQVVPAISSAPAGGIRCSLTDMLAWARNWLVPTPAQFEWLGTEQRARMWEAVTPMPIPRRAREWNRTRYHAYALGFRLADVDGQWTVSHTGTLGGMYSVMTLLPDLRSGFVVLANGDAGEARTVLNQVLLKRFTAPGEPATVDGFAARIAAEPAGGDIPEPDTSSRLPVAPGDLAGWLGTWRDPWLGEARICTVDDRVEFSVAKSPKLSGVVMRVGERLLVDWQDDGVGVEPWLAFSHDGGTRRLAMAKVDPDGDFSSDFEDLAFVRTASCAD